MRGALSQGPSRSRISKREATNSELVEPGLGGFDPGQHDALLGGEHVVPASSSGCVVHGGQPVPVSLDLKSQRVAFCAVVVFGQVSGHTSDMSQWVRADVCRSSAELSHSSLNGSSFGIVNRQEGEL